MQVKNHTNYKTTDLKKLFIKCSQAHYGVAEARDWKYLRVEVKYMVRDDQNLHGYAYYNGNYIRMYMPKDSSKIDMRQIAYTFIHELWHRDGFKHSNMGYWWKSWETGDNKGRVAFADKYKIEEKEIKPTVEKPKEDIQIKRYMKVKRRVEELEKIIKNKKNLLNKNWMPKLRYYEKTLIAANKMPK